MGDCVCVWDGGGGQRAERFSITNIKTLTKKKTWVEGLCLEIEHFERP